MFVALLMGIFLVAFLGFATDYATFWFQRQAVQGAADATCQAAAVDLYRYGMGAQTPAMNFTPSASGVSCTNSPTAAPCLIAKYNGFDASKSGVNVAMSFPLTVAGGGTPAPGVAWPYVKVDVTRQTNAYFSNLLTKQSMVNVHASATCGVLSALGAGQLLILDPYPQITSVSLTGNAGMTVVGGSTVGMQVNSISIRSVSFSGNHALIDMSQGGANYTGSDVAVSGDEASPGSGNYNPGTTGVWVDPDTPELNPYAGLGTPASAKNTNGTTTSVKYRGVAGGSAYCPDPNGCTEYTPGYYPNGISTTGETLIFDAGIYYMDGSLSCTGNGDLRMGAPSATLGKGVMFYFHTGTVTMAGNCGQGSGLDAVASTALTCDGSAPPAGLGIPSAVTGNVLMAQCTAEGTYYDAAGDTGDSAGNIRGLLFFSDISNTSSPDLGGNAISVYDGSEYFHNSSYSVIMNAHGNGSGSAISWGNIVVDNLNIVGNGQYNFLLNGIGTTPVSRIAMIQ